MPRNAEGKFVKAEAAEAEVVAEAEEVVEEAIAAADPVALMNGLFARLQKMEERQAELEDTNAELSQELVAQQARHAAELERVAQAAAEAKATTEPNVLPAEAFEGNKLLRGDHPGTLEDELNARETLARENKQPFDRERVRKILLGEPVEDLNKWVWMGHAFDTEDEMLVYKIMTERQMAQQVGKYPRG